MLLLIEQERINRGWTGAYIAEYLGITKSAVSRILHGENKPCYDVLVKLEDLFELSHRELLKSIEE